MFASSSMYDFYFHLVFCLLSDVNVITIIYERLEMTSLFIFNFDVIIKLTDRAYSSEGEV